jgi:predicted helicase
MDDIETYGEEIYRIGFGQAVEKGLLSDYKVLVLAVSEKEMPVALQKMIASKNQEITVDDASRLIGCINALSKKLLSDKGILDESEPMRRAVAFCPSIKAS